MTVRHPERRSGSRTLLPPPGVTPRPGPRGQPALSLKPSLPPAARLVPPLPIGLVDLRMAMAPAPERAAHFREDKREEEQAHHEERDLRHHRNQDADDAQDEEEDPPREVAHAPPMKRRFAVLRRHGAATAALIRFVLPGTHIGRPAVMTALSPGLSSPFATASADAFSSMASGPSAALATSGTTPHTNASLRAVSLRVASAMMGGRGRWRATRRAVAPDSVQARIAEAPMCSASSTAAPATASGSVWSDLSSNFRIQESKGNAVSVSSAIRFIVATASTG